MLGELEGNLYPCRRMHPARIFMAFPPARRMVAALPAVDSPRLQAALDGILETSPASNVLETALNSPNVVIHLMASLLNLGAVEQSHGAYRLYETGLTPGVLAMLDAMNMEKERLFAAWGWAPHASITRRVLTPMEPVLPMSATRRGQARGESRGSRLM